MKTLNTLLIALACYMPAMAQPTGTAPDTARLDYRLQPRQMVLFDGLGQPVDNLLQRFHVVGHLVVGIDVAVGGEL